MKTDSQLWIDIAEMVDLLDVGVHQMLSALVTDAKQWTAMRAQLYDYFERGMELDKQNKQFCVMACLLLSEMTK